MLDLSHSPSPFAVAISDEEQAIFRTKFAPHRPPPRWFICRQGYP
jgi:hypothetical protein